MRQVNTLKQKLAAGKPVVGMWASLPCPAVVEAMSLSSYDFIIIDSEHGQLNLETTIDMMRACAVGTAEGLVRVPGKDPDYLKRLLDAGATSFMVPMVDTAEQAQAIVNACRYPPRGRRGYAAPIVRGSRYGLDEDYIEWAHEELFLTLQMESAEAAENANAIAAIDGVDQLFIGANDLSGSLGLLTQTAHPDVLAAMEKIKAAARAHGKTLGTIPRPGTPTEALPADGFLLGAGGSDIGWVCQGAKADIAAFRAANG
jgi:4-hydroxy-2-oxoheptanedioate aldolase